jgi:hypothetical protein
MRLKKTNVVILSSCILSLFISPTTSFAGGQGSLQQCQQIQDTINYYANLRREGGSARSMDAWKRKLNEYDDKYTDANCKRWRKKLK